MGTWFKYFFGTPKRFLTTMAVLGLIVVTANPDLLRIVTEGFVAELAPLLGPLLSIAIVFAGLRIITFGKKGKWPQTIHVFPSYRAYR